MHFVVLRSAFSRTHFGDGKSMAGTHSSTPVVAIATVLAGGFVLVIAVDRGLDVLTACAVLGAVVLLLAHRSARRPAGGTSST